MPKGLAVFRSAFHSPDDEFSGRGIRPVVFDILGPDLKTSILGEYRMVLHVNPNSMSISKSKVIERGQTDGGWVEQHFGEGTDKISFDMATGGFMRLYTGLSNITGGGVDAGGSRRQTIAYDKYLDFLALFHNKASVYDTNGKIVFQGIIKVSFDGGTWYGWFDTLTVSEEAEKPYQFSLSADFTVHHEVLGLRTSLALGNQARNWPNQSQELLSSVSGGDNTLGAIPETEGVEADGTSTDVPPNQGGFTIDIPDIGL